MELDPIEQEIIVETLRSIENLKALSGQAGLTDRAMDDLIAHVEAAQAVLDDLEGKDIEIGVIWQDQGYADAIDRATQGVTGLDHAVSHYTDSSSDAIAISRDLSNAVSDAGKAAAQVDGLLTAASGATVEDMNARLATLTKYSDEYMAQVREIMGLTLKQGMGSGGLLGGLGFQGAAAGAGPAVAVAADEQATAAIDEKTKAASGLKKILDELGMGEEDVAVMSGIASAAFMRQTGVTADKKDKVEALAAAAYMVSDAEHGMADSAHDVVSSMEAAGNLVDRNVLSHWKLKEAIEEVGLSEGAVAKLAEESKSSLFEQGAAAKTKADILRGLIESLNYVVDSEGNLAKATADSGDTAQKADKAYRIWGTGIRVTGYGIHWLIAGGMELAAVVIPALFAAASAAAVMAQGAQWVQDRMKGVYTASEATAQMLHKTAGQAIGLGNALQTAQDKATPQVYELLGSVINDLHETFGTFFQQGGKVVDMLDKFAAEVTIDLRSAFGAQTQGLLSGMVQDLVGLGQVFGNLGRIIVTLASSMPGLAQILLGLLAGFTKLAEAVLNFFSVVKIGGVSLLTVVIGFEELFRWGGLLLRIFGSLGGTFGKFLVDVAGRVPALERAGVAIGSMGASMSAAGNETKKLGNIFSFFATNPWGWALIGAVALGALVVWLGRTKTAAQQMADSMQSALSQDTLAQGLSQGIQDLSILQGKLQGVNVESVRTAIATRQIGRAIPESARNAVTYSDTMSSVAQQVASVLSISTRYNGVNYSLVESIGLASAAGVKMNQMLDKNGNLSQVATQMILNLIAGYKAMAQTGGTLNADIQAVNVSALEQQTRVQQLNQAWDEFIKNVTGGTSAIAGMYADMETMGNVTLSAKNKIQAFNQQAQGTKLSVDQIAQALTSFSGTSAQVWQNYNQLVTQANTTTDWLRTAASQGAVTSTQYANSVKGVVSMLLPYAKYSATAAAEASALAYQVTGTTMNYQQLTGWVGNANEKQKTLNNTINTATQAMANLNQVAQNLSSTMSTAVDNALTQGTVDTKGIMTATQNLRTQLTGAHADFAGATPAVYAWTKQMYDASVGADNAKAIIYQLAGNMHLSASQAHILAGEVYDLYLQMSRIHDVSAKITVTTYQQMVTLPGTSAGIPAGIAAPGGHHAAGYRVPGYGGGDRHLAMLEGGEAVVPKHLVSAIAPFLGAHGVPGFAHGGVMRPPHHQGPTPMEAIIQQWGREVWAQEKHKYGAHSPIAFKEMQALFGGTHPGKGAAWKNPQYRLLEYFERMDMMKYYLRDIEYWKLASKLGAPHGRVPFVKYLEEERMLQEMMKQLYGEMGYSRGGRVPFGHYDQGGYLPPGLSMALNTTGRPEPVGGAGVPVHLHIEVGGREVASAMIPDLIGAANRYSRRQSGRSTGILRPTR